MRLNGFNSKLGSRLMAGFIANLRNRKKSFRFHETAKKSLVLNSENANFFPISETKNFIYSMERLEPEFKFPESESRTGNIFSDLNTFRNFRWKGVVFELFFLDINKNFGVIFFPAWLGTSTKRKR